MFASPSVSRLCLGTAQLGLDYGIANSHGRPDDATCESLLSHAVARGVRCFDTARAYGDAEQRLGRFLANHAERHELRVVSKLPAMPCDLSHHEVLAWVSAEIDDSLQTLGVERLAAWLVHDPTTAEPGGEAIWDAMVAQVDRGVTERIGMSVYDEHELRSALDRSETSAVQLPLNLFDHRALRAGLLDRAANHGTTVYARSALLQGLLTFSPTELPDELPQLKSPVKQLHDILARYERAPLDVALPLVLAHPQVDFAVIGVDNVSQLDDNLARAETDLPDGLIDELRSAFRDLPAEVLEPRRW